MAFIKILSILSGYIISVLILNSNNQDIDFLKENKDSLNKTNRENKNSFYDKNSSFLDFLKKNRYEISESLSNIAKEINNIIEKDNKLSFSEKELRDIIYKNKFYFYRVFPKTFHKSSENYLENMKIFLLMNQNSYNSIGISESENYFTILIAYQPFELFFKDKKQYKPYQKISIKGKNLNFKLPYIDFYIKTPSNDVKKFLIPIVRDGFSFDFKFNEIGTYIIELIENQESNPRIIAKFPIKIESKKSKLSNKNDINSYSFCELKNIETIEDVFEEINSIRKSKNLSHLILSSELSEVAEKHSFDMANNVFFSHISKNGKTPSQRVQEQGFFFKKILENISKANSICAAYLEILESPGHLNNILDKNINYIGIGIYEIDDYIFMTQDFIEKEDINSITLKKK